MVQAAFVGERTSVVYLEPARINQESKHEKQDNNIFQSVSKDLEGTFCLNNCIPVGGSRYSSVLADLRLCQELPNSTDLLFRPKAT